MKRFWIAPAMVAALSACAGPTLHSAPKMPDYARTCDTTSAPGPCLAELQRAAEQGDRARTGQLLLLAARTAPVTDRRDLARAASWLAPEAWVPEELRALLDDDDLAVIGGSQGAAGKLEAGTVLRLRGAADGVPSGVPVVEVDLAVPTGPGLLGGDGLAGLVASASGADAAAYGDGRGAHLAAGAPLMSRVLGTGVGLAPDAWQSARAVAGADRALRAGQQVQAWLMLEAAIASLPAGAPPCTSRGELDYLRATIARISFEGTDIDTLADLRKVCTEASVAESERLMQAYLRAVLALQTNLSTAAGELPAPWSTPSSLQAWSTGIDELARTLGDRRADILRALRDDLLARASQPEGRCDEDWPARVKAQRAAAKQAIAASGRDDLAMPTVQTKVEGLRIEAMDVDAVLGWVGRPENRWLRVPTLAGVLSDPSLQLAGEVHRAKIERVCATAFDELLLEIKRDRLEGYDSRNVSRWFAASRGITLCRRMDSIATLSDELLKGALQGKGGKVGALKVLMLTGFQALEAVLNGRAHEGIIAIKVLKDGLVRLSGQLGAGDEDRALDAVIGVVGAAVDRVMSQSGELGVALERAAATLEPIARKPPSPQAPDLVRAAPGIHLAALALLAAVDAMDQDTRGRDAALQRVQASLDRDVQALLSSFGVPEQGPAILRVVKAATALAHAADSTTGADLDALLRAVEEASKPGETEPRWWGVGLNLGRLVLWDLAAATMVKSAGTATAGPAVELTGDPRVARVLDGADKSLIRLTDGVVRDWGNGGTSWEFLYVTPAIHRGVVALVLAPEGADDKGEIAANAMQGGLDAGLSRMSEKIRAAKPADVGFLAVLIDALELARDGGGMPALVKQAQARVKWARRLREMSASYPSEYRIVIDAATAAAEFEADSARARAQLQEAAKEAANSQFGDVAWLPRLVEAALLYHDDDVAAALQSVDAVVAQAKEAAPCNKPHEVAGLQPFRAWALERLGRHADADAALRAYVTSTQKGGGDGFVQCRLVSYRNAFTFTADVKQRLGSVFFPTSSEGTFQIGAGYGDSRNYDRLTCISTPLLMPRLDLLANASLMRAAYALRASDDTTANAALLEAISAARAMVHGDVASLGVNDGAGVEEDRKHAFLPLMVYVAGAARARGHLAAADKLEGAAVAIASARTDSVAAALESRAGLPLQLDKLGFDVLTPIVATAWEESGDKKADKPAERGPSTPSGASAVPAWATPLLESYALLRRNHPEQAGAALKKLRAPEGDALARITVARAKSRVEGSKGPAPRTQGVLLDMQALAAAGMYTEVQARASEQASRLMEAKKSAEAEDVFRKALGLIPADRAALARADLLVDMGTQLPDMRKRADWVKPMAEVEPALQGRVPLQQEVAVLQRILSYLSQSDDPAAVLPHLSRLRGVLERALGSEHLEALKLALCELMVRSLGSEPASEDVEDVLARIHKAGTAGEPLIRALDAWRATQADAAARRTLVVRFVQQVLVQ